MHFLIYERKTDFLGSHTLLSASFHRDELEQQQMLDSHDSVSTKKYFQRMKDGIIRHHKTI